MSCHTWTYKKVSALSKEEKQKFINKEIDFLKNWWGFKKPFSKVVDEVSEWLKHQPQVFEEEFAGRTPEQYAKDLIKEYQNKLNLYENQGFSTYLIEYRHNSHELITYKDETYIKIGFDTPCRIYGYREDKFTNVEDFINFLKTTDSDLGFYNDNNDFIEGFSSELEKRIRDYFKKHGENNLLIQFG